MEIITGPRGSGKTAALIRACAADQERNYTLIVCQSLQRAVDIQAQARQLGLYIPTPITFRKFLSGEYRAHKVYIDDADQLLTYIAGAAQVAAITLPEIRELDPEAEPFPPIPAHLREMLAPGFNILESHQRPGGVISVTRVHLYQVGAIPPSPEEGDQDAS